MKQPTLSANIRQYIREYETQIIEIERLNIYPFLIAILYIVLCVGVLISLKTPKNELDLTVPSKATMHLYDIEQRDTAPKKFRWLAQ
jgi:hypothetical protein